MLDASFTISAESESGRSGCAIGLVELEGSLVGAALGVVAEETPPSPGSCSASVEERERARLTRSLIPLEAVLLAAVYSLAASP